MMRYAILLAMMLLGLPVRGETWQVVGGESLGPELVLNSMFNSNSVANWTGTNATVSSTNNELIVSSTSYGSAAGAINGSFTQGAQYKFTIKIVSNSGGATRCVFKVGDKVVVSSTSQTGVFTGYVSSFINIWGGVRVAVEDVVSGVCTVDDVSVKRVL